MLETMVGALWTIVTLPFRLLFGAVELLGRLTALLVGFALMVVGVAFWVSPAPVVGVPVFVVGLLLTMRALG